MDDDGLGFRFWGGLIGAVLLAGIGLFVLLLIIDRAYYAWGALGTFVAIGAILLFVAWIYDRRQARLYEEEVE